jgi:hypothetical protein
VRSPLPIVVAVCLMVQALPSENIAIAQPTKEPNDVASVTKAEAKCIADNVDTFLDDEHDPVTIYLDICIPAEKLSGLVAGNFRIDLPNIGQPQQPGQGASGDSSAPKSVNVSKAALRCLKSAAAAAGFPSTDPYRLVADCH